MDLKKEISNILKEVFLDEAKPSLHFKDRVYTRLSSQMYTRPNFNYSEIEEQINVIKKINFNPEESFAIQIKTFPTTYTSKDPVNGNASIGNELWAVVRNNVITTIFFRASSQRNEPVTNIDNSIKFINLLNFYNTNKKNEDGTVDFEINSLKNKNTKQSSLGNRKKVELDLPMVEIGGAMWFIDEQNEVLIFSKNTNKKIHFNDLKEEYFEKVIAAALK